MCVYMYVMCVYMSLYLCVCLVFVHVYMYIQVPKVWRVSYLYTCYVYLRREEGGCVYIVCKSNLFC